MTKTLFELNCPGVTDTENAGAALAALMQHDSALPHFAALCGGLGAGKTAFTRGFCSVVCPASKVRSPSFALVNEYRGNPDVYHFDVWRIKDEDDLYSTGFFDYFNREGIILCEWADNIAEALPDEYIRVDISGDGDSERRVTVKLHTSEKT